MAKEQLDEFYQMTIAIQQQQSNSDLNNEDSSGGTNRTEIKSTDNLVSVYIERSIWLEEAIYHQVGEASRANYKTLARRVSQNLRSKPEFKTQVIQAQNQTEMGSLVDSFVSGRAP